MYSRFPWSLTMTFQPTERTTSIGKLTELFLCFPSFLFFVRVCELTVVFICVELVVVVVSAERVLLSTWSLRMTSARSGTSRPSTTPLWRKCPWTLLIWSKTPDFLFSCFPYFFFVCLFLFSCLLSSPSLFSLIPTHIPVHVTPHKSSTVSSEGANLS